MSDVYPYERRFAYRKLPLELRLVAQRCQKLVIDFMEGVKLSDMRRNSSLLALALAHDSVSMRQSFR